MTDGHATPAGSEGATFVIRRKVLKLFGAAFYIRDPAGSLIGYCKQRAFKLKEDIRIYADEACTSEWITIKARSIIDFGSTYDVARPDGRVLGSLRRRGLASTFVRDSWLVFDAGGREVAQVREDGSALPVLRRFVDFVAVLFPQRYSLVRNDGAVLATFRQRFNPFIYQLEVRIAHADPAVEDALILAVGCLITAIEGYQAGG